MTATVAELETLIAAGNNLVGLSQSVSDVSKNPTGTDQAAALLNITGFISGLIGSPNTPFLQALGVGVGVNASVLGISVNAAQLSTALSNFQQAVQTGNAALTQAAQQELADKALGLVAAIGGTLIATRIPAVQPLGLAIWLGGTAAQQFMNGNAQRALDIVGGTISEAIAELVGGSSATVRQYDIGQGELVTFEFTDRYGISQGEFGKLSGMSTIAVEVNGGYMVYEYLNGSKTPTNSYFSTSAPYVSQQSQATIPLSEEAFAAGYDYASAFDYSGYGGNSIDFGMELLESIGVGSDEFGGYLSPSSDSYEFSELLNWFSYPQGDSFYQQYFDPDFEADTRLARLNYLQSKTGPTLHHSAIDEKVQSGIASPIVIDLNGDGIKLLSLAEGVNFDITGDGVQEQTGWLSNEDGFLSLDRNENGAIDDVNEMFGGRFRGQGYAELSELDSNGDRLIDQQDALFSKLLVWRDNDSNGSSELAELLSVSDAGVTSLSLSYRSQDVWQKGNLIGEVSSAQLVSGTTDMADVYFHYRKSGAVVDQAARGLSENELTLQMANSLIGQMAQFLPTESGHGESFNSQTAFQIDILAAAPT